jgi:DNA-binding MarR family transcriptional regulator
MEQDSVDRHIAHWIKEIPELDPLTEGVITRMQLLVKHLKQQRHASAAARELEDFEFETLHMLGGCPGNQATPGEIAAWLYMSPAAITGRIDALERRGLVRRLPAPGDRRKVLVQLTAAGRRVWRVAGNEQGAEEQRILAALDNAEQKELAGFLRRMLLVVDRPELLPTPGAKRSRGRAARGR